MVDGDFVKLHVALDADAVGVGGESFWARTLPGRDDVFVVDNVLVFAPFGCDDHVSAVEHDGRWQVTGVVKRSPRSTIMVALSYPGGQQSESDVAAVTSALKAMAQWANEHGGAPEAMAGHNFLVVYLPDGLVDENVSAQTFPDRLPFVSELLSHVDQLKPSLPALQRTEVSWATVACPGDPTGVVPPMRGLVADTWAAQVDDGYRVEGPDRDMWCAAFAAIQTEHFTSIPEHMLLANAQQQYDRDERVRNEVAGGSCDDSAMLVWRAFMAAYDQLLPALDRALFTESEQTP